MASLLERVNVWLNNVSISYYRELQELSQGGGYMYRLAQRRIQKKQAYNDAVRS